MVEVVVVGQIARDLVLRVDELPTAGRAAEVRLRRELLGAVAVPLDPGGRPHLTAERLRDCLRAVHA